MLCASSSCAETSVSRLPFSKRPTPYLPRGAGRTEAAVARATCTPDLARGWLGMRKNDWYVAGAGLLVALAAIGLMGLVVVRLGSTAPAITAAVLVAMAGVLAA